MECVMRKGGAGVAPEHAPLSKAAAIRTIEDGFGIQHTSNIDLVLRRKSRPEEETLRGHAGSIARDRRRLDMPDVIRQRSIEHIVQRRHSEPPSRVASPPRGENLLHRLSSVGSDADRIGRNVKGRSRSPAKVIVNPPTSPRRSPRNRSRSPMKLRDLEPPPWMKPGSFFRSQSADAAPCTWGESLAFESLYSGLFNHYEGEPPSPSSLRNQPLPEEPVIVDTTQPLEVLSDAAEILKMRAVSGSGRWSSKNSDDGKSTMSTAISGGPTSPTSAGHSSSCMFSDTLRSDSTTFSGQFYGGSTASNVMTFAKTVDKRFAQIYERRIKAMVKEEQKKSMKRAK